MCLDIFNGGENNNPPTRCKLLGAVLDSQRGGRLGPADDELSRPLKIVRPCVGASNPVAVVATPFGPLLSGRLLRGACHRAALCADPLARNDVHPIPRHARACRGHPRLTF